MKKHTVFKATLASDFWGDDESHSFTEQMNRKRLRLEPEAAIGHVMARCVLSVCQHGPLDPMAVFAYAILINKNMVAGDSEAAALSEAAMSFVKARDAAKQ